MEYSTFEVKNLNYGRGVLGVATRAVRKHAGWESVTYRKKRYQLFGGIRVPEFIDLANPIKGKSCGGSW